MKIIGLTGGIGSGKSTVSRMLRELGAPIIDADELARKVVEPGLPALREIARRFPDVIENGQLNRSKLAERIFASETDRAALNAIVHPRIQEEFEGQKRGLAAKGVPVAIYDAALLIENKIHENVDGVILVEVPEEVQLARLQARDRISRDAAGERIASQIPLTQKRRYARWIIDNSGSLDSTRDQTRRVWNEICGQFKERKA